MCTDPFILSGSCKHENETIKVKVNLKVNLCPCA